MTCHAPHRPRKLVNRCQPQIEALEDRTCPSCTILRAGSTALVLGDNGANNVRIVESGGTPQITCDIAEAVGSGITRLVIKTAGGNDTVTYGKGPQAISSLRVDLGAGDDTAALLFQRPPLANPGGGFAANRPILAHVTGGSGDDVVLAEFGELDSTKVNFQAMLGDGDDTFAALLEGDISSRAGFNTSLLQFNVQGGNGNDSLDVEADGISTTVNPASISWTLRGNAGDDAIGINVNATLNYQQTTWIPRYFRLTVDGGSGDDLLAVSVRNSSTQVPCSVSVYGGSGDDNLTVDVPIRIYFSEVDGGAGIDTCTDNLPFAPTSCENRFGL